MRLLLAAAAFLVATSSAALADDFPCVSTTFNLLSPNDKVCISDFDDPAVPGVTCFISQTRTGGWGQQFSATRGGISREEYLQKKRDIAS
jgi:CreA protein